MLYIPKQSPPFQLEGGGYVRDINKAVPTNGGPVTTYSHPLPCVALSSRELSPICGEVRYRVGLNPNSLWCVLVTSTLLDQLELGFLG